MSIKLLQGYIKTNKTKSTIQNPENPNYPEIAPSDGKM